MSELASESSGTAAGSGPTKEAMSEAAGQVWAQMSAFVLGKSARREVSDALGMSFGRIRVLRRIAARGPMSMRELVTLLQSDAPNVTVAVDELEERDWVVRTPHPSDRRSKLVDATAAGRRAARKAETILARPPAGFERLDEAELAELQRLLTVVIGDAPLQRY